MNNSDEIRWLGREQARRVDTLAMERGTSGLVLMERAGAACAERIAVRFQPRTVWIVCGVGNNGGDGLVIARHLLARNVAVRLWLIGDQRKLTADSKKNLERWQTLGGSFEDRLPQSAAEVPDLVVDCLLGTGSQGDPRPPVAEAIEWLNGLSCPRVAIDLPSGLDCDSGVPGKPTVRADWTLTMVGPKLGFAAAEARELVGQWEVIDLELPGELIAQAVGHPRNEASPRG